jgi:ATP synthase protein I
MPDHEERKEAKRSKGDEEFARKVRAKEERKLKKRREGEHSAWFGLGMFGLVGWSVAIPTVIGVAIGLWLDAKFEGRRSWTLTFLFIGIVVGCVNAWYWIKRESSKR